MSIKEAEFEVRFKKHDQQIKIIQQKHVISISCNNSFAHVLVLLHANILNATDSTELNLPFMVTGHFISLCD